MWFLYPVFTNIWIYAPKNKYSHFCLKIDLKCLIVIFFCFSNIWIYAPKIWSSRLILAKRKLWKNRENCLHSVEHLSFWRDFFWKFQFFFLENSWNFAYIQDTHYKTLFILMRFFLQNSSQNYLSSLRSQFSKWDFLSYFHTLWF